MLTRILVALAAVGLIATACGDSGDTTTTTAAVPAGPAVVIATSDLGDILTDADGNTLYLFTVDTQGGDTSACTGDCLATWPALAGPVTAGDGADGSLLGTITRDDGSTQATYNGWPLYYFAADAAAGDTNGQGVGDVWWVIDPAGDPVQ